MKNLFGKRVEPWGLVVGVACLEGERYYWFDSGGEPPISISMIPADVVENEEIISKDS